MRCLAALFLLIIVFSFITSCINRKPIPEITPGLFGKWEIRGSVLSQTATKAYDPGNGNIFQFNSDSTYKVYKGGKLILVGKFHTKDIKKTGVNLKGIILFEKEDVIYSIRLNGNQLSLSPIEVDGGGDDYIKIAN